MLSLVAMPLELRDSNTHTNSSLIHLLNKRPDQCDDELRLSRNFLSSVIKEEIIQDLHTVNRNTKFGFSEKSSRFADDFAAIKETQLKDGKLDQAVTNFLDRAFKLEPQDIGLETAKQASIDAAAKQILLPKLVKLFRENIYFNETFAMKAFDFLKNNDFDKELKNYYTQSLEYINQERITSELLSNPAEFMIMKVFNVISRDDISAKSYLQRAVEDRRSVSDMAFTQLFRAWDNTQFLGSLKHKEEFWQDTARVIDTIDFKGIERDDKRTKFVSAMYTLLHFIIDQNIRFEAAREIVISCRNSDLARALDAHSSSMIYKMECFLS